MPSHIFQRLGPPVTARSTRADERRVRRHKRKVQVKDNMEKLEVMEVKLMETRLNLHSREQELRRTREALEVKTAEVAALRSRRDKEENPQDKLSTILLAVYGRLHSSTDAACVKERQRRGVNERRFSESLRMWEQLLEALVTPVFRAPWD